MRALLVVALVVAVPLAGCLDVESEDAPSALGPAWAFTDTHGVTHARDGADGNATFLFFMATWCGTCKQAAPMLSDVHADYAHEGVRFLSVSVDHRDEALDAWKERYDHPWPHGVDEVGGMRGAFNVRSTSTMVILDADGRVVENWGSPGAGETELRAALNAVTSP
jgi:thiol-disulfide isomerase/thioredoxin